MPRRVLPALVALALALAGASLAACGAEKKQAPSAAELLRQTFRGSATTVDDGRLSLSFRLDPEGLLAVGGPVKLTLDGPFRAARAKQLPRFDVDVVATLNEQDYGANVRSTGTKALLTLDDGTYEVQNELVARLRRAAKPVGDRGGLPVVGFDPLRWISAPQTKGSERVSGVDTIRIRGRLDVVALLADLDRLLGKAAGPRSGPTLLSATLRRQIAAAVDSSSVDVWTGAADRIVRQVAVKIIFFFKDGSSPLQVLNGGTINLRLRLDDVNAKAEPVSTFAAPAPKGTRPLAELTGGSAGNILGGIGAGITAGKGRELLACLTAANGSSSTLVRCVSKLAP